MATLSKLTACVPVLGLRGLFCRQLAGHRDGGDHAVCAGQSFPGNLEGCAVIGAGSGKWQAERHVYPLVEGVEF